MFLFCAFQPRLDVNSTPNHPNAKCLCCRQSRSALTSPKEERNQSCGTDLALKSLKRKVGVYAICTRIHGKEE